MSDTPTDPEPLSEQLARVGEAAAARANTVAKAIAGSPLGTQLATKVAAARDAAIYELWQRTAPAKYVDAAVEDFDQDVQTSLGRWLDAWQDGVNLIVSGPVGSGKTHAAFAAARRVLGPDVLLPDRFVGSSVLYAPEVELKDGLDWRAEGHREQLHEAQYIGLLMLDDLGVEQPNEWWAAKLYAIINRRWLEDLPTIVTTNLDPPALRAAIGERTHSRLADHAIGIRLTGEDRRRG